MGNPSPYYNAANPCPVCGTGTKNCRLGNDGELQLCRLPPDRHADSERWHEIPKKNPANEWRQFIPRDVQEQRDVDWRRGNTPPRPRMTNKTEKPPIDWNAKADGYARRFLAEKQYQQMLAERLRLPVKSIAAVSGIGCFDTQKDGTVFTFPEFDGAESIIGIIRRFPNGDKIAIAQSSRGLSLPDMWKAGDGPIFIVEGPSDTIAMSHAGLCCVGRPSAILGAEQLAELLKDWPKDRPIIVVGEYDRKDDGSWPGKTGAETVARKLSNSLNRSVNITFPPDGSKDARDWLTHQNRGDSTWAERGTQLSDLLMTNIGLDGPTFDSSAEWEQPIPLTQAFDGVPTFPIQMLPPWMRGFAEALATELQVPIDLPALLVLGVAGAGIARKVIVIPRTGWDEPTNLFVMGVLPPGERKSQTFRKVLSPITELERELNEAMKSEIATAQSELRIAEKRVQHLESKLIKDEGGDCSALKDQLTTAREELQRIVVPPHPVLRVDDDTPEMLAKELVQQGGRLLAASPEASALENISRYGDTPNMDVYLKGHAGDDLRSGRISRGRVSIDRAALSCLFTPQPAVLTGLAETPELRGRGFLARWFYAMPISKVGYREIGTEAIPASIRYRYETAMRQMWHVNYLDGDQPHELRFDRKADYTLREFQAWVEVELRSEEMLAETAGWGSKLCGLAVRIAGILHVGDGINSNWQTMPISASTIERAIVIAKDYAIPHSLSAFDLMGATEAIINARKLWNWIIKRKNPREPFIKRKAFNALRATFGTVDKMEPSIDLLELHFLIRPEGGPLRPGPGRKPSPTFEVNPFAFDGRATAHNTQNGLRDVPDPNCAYCARGIEVENLPVVNADAEDDSDDDYDDDGNPTNHDPNPEPPQPQPSPGHRLITDADDVAKLAERVRKAHSPVGLDTETTGLNPDHDRVRLIQLALTEETAIVDCFAFDDPKAPLSPLLDALATVEIVGHNLGFDVRFLAKLGFVPGRVFCTMLASQVLHAGERVGHKLADVLQRELDISISKDEQKSNWSGTLTDSQLRYAAEDVRQLPKLAEVLCQRLDDAKLTPTATLEMRSLLGIAWALPITVDNDRWSSLARQAEADKVRLADEMDALVPNSSALFNSRNWNSNPEVMAAFKSLGVTIKNTADETLAGIDHPLAKLLRDYRAACKRSSTYGTKWLIDHAPEGVVWPSWNQCGAESGRMSCKTPNLQQIPRTADYRRCFIARPGCVLIKADYSQIELRIAAKLADETTMIAAYQNGDDLHALTAANILGKQIHDVSKGDRQLAKAINFGLLFGMGHRSLRQYAATNYGTELTEAQAKQYRDAFFRSYPKLKAWHQRTSRTLEQLAAKNPDAIHETRSLAGRRRILCATKANTEGRRYPNLNEALNTPVQATGADGLKAAIALSWERRSDCPEAVPLLFAHDEIVLECPADNAEASKQWLIACMVDGMAPLINPIPVEVEATIAKTWGG